MNDIETFLTVQTYAVAGASLRREKYGNKVFRALLAAGRQVYPLNPAQDEIEGHRSYRSLTELPTVPDALSIITPPIVTRQVVAEAISVGVKHVWMQPGANDTEASQMAREAGINVIDNGSCILVVLAGYR